MANRRIDVHHHYVPPFYAQALTSNGGDPSGWTIPIWTIEKDIQFCDQEKIAFSILSITAPGSGILPTENEQVQFCRQANQYAARAQAEYPARYGFFASIPSLLDLQAALSEIIYALDTLRADGIVLYTRYGKDNHYLGHPDFRPVWDLLNNRGAVVFVHPTHPVDTSLINPLLPQPMIDYPHETTRTACDLITSGTIRSFPRVKIILSHAGGTLPYLALRPAAMLPYIPAELPAVYRDLAISGSEVTKILMEDARSFYFDTALSASPHQLCLLSEFAKPGHILFGSDFPYAPTPAISQMNQLLDEFEEQNRDFATSLNTEAALALFPRLREYFSP
ncbi:hypothetical protein F4678DRAFT_265328 [Xylaria arbuscula]|nr:hypothetical protein F4678DRAFT_265328 [Xylaria arbuscula]